MTSIESWGRYPKTTSRGIALGWRDDPLPLPQDGTVLPYGLGRSYGDSCLNDGGSVLLTRGLSRLMDFDPATGVLRCEAGVSLAEILELAVPRGWFLPVTPGTKFVTLGGAIANDVHGKNHVLDGTFGRFVRAFELLRSDGSRLRCSSTENQDLYRATIGGLGLTGLITWAEIQLKKVPSGYIHQETIRLRRLDDFFEINERSEKDWLYTVAWIDCLAKGSRLGRGIYFRGNHADAPWKAPVKAGRTRLSVPFDAPGFLLGSWSMKLFNAAIYRKPTGKGLVSYDPFFYPLDAVGRWNRAYGKRGLLQWQCVVPDPDTIVRVLEAISDSREGSFLVVLKTFGTLPSPGLLSFPRPGITLALDFPNKGASTLRLLDRMFVRVLADGGALYPAKDARMSPALFRASFPAWEELARHADPRFSSSFWRRVCGAEATLAGQPRLGALGS